MKLAQRKNIKPSEQRRNQMQTDRIRSLTLRETFPKVGNLRIELKFSDGGIRTPSPQLHTLYPAARAFFRYTCPCADCDGDFDLTGAITALTASGSRNPRTATGEMLCAGVRLRDRVGSKPCAMQLSYTLITAAESAA